MAGMAGTGKAGQRLNPRADLSALVAALPKQQVLDIKELGGRSPLPEKTRLRRGDYELHLPIGSGSFGLIYAATDTRIGQLLAIKEFYPTDCVRTSENDWTVRSKAGGNSGELGVLRTQFEEEFRVLERFERPGIVKVYDLFEENGGVFLVMELLQGATFEELLSRYKTFEESLALWLIRQLVNTLETIHLSGLVHGDIKPENLFLTHEGQVILLDFGAVNHYLSRGKKSPRFLTPGYAPPEQYEPNRKPDPASDLYAVGATLYELLTGSPPPDSVQRTRGARLPSPSRKGADVTPETQSALGRTLSLTQEKRPSSAHALLGLLPESQMQGFYSAPPWEQLTSWPEHRQAICKICLTSNEKFLASADKSGELRLWSLEQNRCIGVIDFDKEVADIAIHPEDKFLAVALAGGQVELIDFSSGHSEGTLRTGAPPVSALSFSPDGRILICALYDGTIELRSMLKRNRKKSLRAHESPVNDASFSPSGRLLALASNDRSASIWDLKSNRRVRQFSGHHRPVQTARFSPSGKFLLTGGSDMSLKVFDVKRGDEFRRLKGHEATVWDMLYLKDDHYLISCSADKTVRLWDMTRFREVGKLSLGEGWLTSMAFAHSSSTLYIGGVDKTIFRLRISPHITGSEV